MVTSVIVGAIAGAALGPRFNVSIFVPTILITMATVTFVHQSVGACRTRGRKARPLSASSPSRDQCVKSGGIAGRSPSFGTLQTGHGIPGSPHRQAFG